MGQERNVLKNENFLALNENENKTYPDLLDTMDEGSSKTDASPKNIALSASIRKLERSYFNN